MTHSVKSNTFPSCSSRRIKFIWPRHITKECKKSKKTQESGRLILENTDSYSCSACAWKSRSEHDTQFGFCITCCCRLACLCFHSFMINHANVQTMISTDIWSCADGFFFCFFLFFYWKLAQMSKGGKYCPLVQLHKLVTCRVWSSKKGL